MRNWSDVANFTATSLNDFKMILGMDFLIATKAVLMPHLEFIGFVEEGSSCMVRVVRGEPSKGKAISAIQLKKGSKRETTYLAVLEMEDFRRKAFRTRQGYCKEPSRGVISAEASGPCYQVWHE